MTIEEGCYSLKLECALRDLGFVEVGCKVIAHAGIFFVSPVGFGNHSHAYDDLLGFSIFDTYQDSKYLILPTAKRALDRAFEMS